MGEKEKKTHTKKILDEKKKIYQKKKKMASRFLFEQRKNISTTRNTMFFCFKQSVKIKNIRWMLENILEEVAYRTKVFLYIFFFKC